MRVIRTHRLRLIATNGALIRLDLLTPRHGLRLVAAQIKADHRRGVEPSGWWAWAVLAGRRLVGHVGFAGPPDETGWIELGFAFTPAGQGQGYGREAVVALVAWAEDQGATAVWATTEPDNRPAQGLMQAIGMRPQAGRWWLTRCGAPAECRPE